jgi:hypothetical protein
MRHPRTGEIRQVAARFTNREGVEYVWLIDDKSDDDMPLGYRTDTWEPYTPPVEPKTGEIWETSKHRRVKILDHREIKGVHVFVYRFEHSVSDNVHVRSSDEEQIKQWRKVL